MNDQIKPSTIRETINTSFNYLGISTVVYSAGTISQNIINRMSGTTDVLTNLFYSFGYEYKSHEPSPIVD